MQDKISKKQGPAADKDMRDRRDPGNINNRKDDILKNSYDSDNKRRDKNKLQLRSMLVKSYRFIANDKKDTVSGYSR